MLTLVEVRRGEKENAKEILSETKLEGFAGYMFLLIEESVRGCREQRRGAKTRADFILSFMSCARYVLTSNSLLDVPKMKCPHNSSVC